MSSMLYFKGIKKWARRSLPLVLAAILATGCGHKEADVPLDEVVLDLQVIRLDEALYESMQTLKQDTATSPKALFDKHFGPAKGFITDWIFGGNDSIATDSLIGDAMAAFSREPQGQALLDTIHEVLGNWDIKAALEAPLKRYKYYFPNKTTPIVCAYADGYPRTAQAGLDQIYISPTYLGIGVHYFMGPRLSVLPSRLATLHQAALHARAPALTGGTQDGRAHRPRTRPAQKSRLDRLCDHRGHQNVLCRSHAGAGGIRFDQNLLRDRAARLGHALRGAHLQGPRHRPLLCRCHRAAPLCGRQPIYLPTQSRGSAPRLGQYIGWRIVASYMDKHPETTLDALVEMKDCQKIFKDSGYRPPKEE